MGDKEEENVSSCEMSPTYDSEGVSIHNMLDFTRDIADAFLIYCQALDWKVPRVFVKCNFIRHQKSANVGCQLILS